MVLEVKDPVKWQSDQWGGSHRCRPQPLTRERIKWFGSKSKNRCTEVCWAASAKSLAERKYRQEEPHGNTRLLQQWRGKLQHMSEDIRCDWRSTTSRSDEERCPGNSRNGKSPFVGRWSHESGGEAVERGTT